MVPARSVRVPGPTWTAAKHRASKDGTTVSEVVQRLLMEYAAS